MNSRRPPYSSSLNSSAFFRPSAFLNVIQAKPMVFWVSATTGMCILSISPHSRKSVRKVFSSISKGRFLTKISKSLFPLPLPSLHFPLALPSLPGSRDFSTVKALPCSSVPLRAKAFVTASSLSKVTQANPLQFPSSRIGMFILLIAPQSDNFFFNAPSVVSKDIPLTNISFLFPGPLPLPFFSPPDLSSAFTTEIVRPPYSSPS
mmetsp:Transcript_49844/g.132332  ORF Transcript_49844/g.132332 Transcript_49844/m.132332 type:complete len:205 (-) Transcript_49844:744-1358(-)